MGLAVRGLMRPVARNQWQRTVSRSHSLMVVSSEAEARKREFEAQAMSFTPCARVQQRQRGG